MASTAAVLVPQSSPTVLPLDAEDVIEHVGDALQAARRAFDHTRNLPSPPDDEELRSSGICSFLTTAQRESVDAYRKALKLSPQSPEDEIPGLSEHEQALVAKLRAAADDVCEDDRDRAFACDNNVLVRYLRAREWNLDAALKMLTESVARRRASQPETLSCRQCVNDFPCGDIRFVGWDRQQRPIAYSSFARSRNRSTENAVTHTVAAMEKTRLLASAGHPGTICWITHFAGFSWRDLNPQFALAATRTFMNDYPEMLGLFIVIDAPRIFSPVWKATSAILNERTRKKIQFLDTSAGREASIAALSEHMTEEQAGHILDLLQKDRDHLAGN